MSREFAIHNAGLLLAMALAVALPRAGIPAWLTRFATPRWALLLPGPIAVVVAGIALVPEAADALTWLALIGVPIGAAVALGWAMHGGRPWLAPLAAPLLAVAWLDQDALPGDLAALALTMLSCVALGRLLAGLAPLGWLEIGIVAMALIDAVLVFSNGLEQPNAVLNAAVPAPGLPQLQFERLGVARLGYGDLFVAGVLGGIVAARGTSQWRAALLTFVLLEAFTLLFYVTDTLPATVPVAVALLILRRGWAGRTGQPIWPRRAEASRL